MKLTEEEVKHLTQMLRYSLYKDYYTYGWGPVEVCDCGGVFEFVKLDFPYNEPHLQCTMCDGTKSL